MPPLRPLSLAVKAFLRQRSLNEVFTGGLSSYARVNMVLAHLLVRGGARVGVAVAMTVATWEAWRPTGGFTRGGDLRN